MPAIVPSAWREVMPEMNTSRPRASIMVAWEKWPDGWRIFAEVTCCLGMHFSLDARWMSTIAGGCRLRLSPLSRLGLLRFLALRWRFDLDEDVAVLPIAAVAKLVGNA